MPLKAQEAYSGSLEMGRLFYLSIVLMRNVFQINPALRERYNTMDVVLFKLKHTSLSEPLKRPHSPF